MCKGLANFSSTAPKRRPGLTPKVAAVPAAAESLMKSLLFGDIGVDNRLHLSRMQSHDVAAAGHLADSLPMITIARTLFQDE